MLAEIRKSFAAAVYERTTTPLYGAFIFAWLVWNWKIPYVTFFVDQAQLDKSKIDWIITNCSSISSLIIYPTFSCILLVGVLPFAANGAYWISLRFRQWRIDKKNEVEKKSLLTLEQSIQLREELLDAETRLERLLENKNEEIKRLSIQVKSLEDQLQSIADDNTVGEISETFIGATEKGEDEIEKLVSKISNSNDLLRTFKKAVEYCQGGYQGLVEADGVSTQALAFLEATDLIESEKGGTFKLTKKGKEVVARQYDESF